MKLYTKKETGYVEKSIQKWERIVDRTDVDEGIKNCALCKEYYHSNIPDYYCPDYYCIGCPIKEFIGISECRHTPYTDWLHVQPISNSFIFQNTNDETQKAAEAELEFLKMIKLYTIRFRKFT